MNESATAGGPGEESTIVLSRSWQQSGCEASFAIRAVAGAARRFSDVTVATPDPGQSALADGGFDVHPIGGRQHTWPSLGETTLPTPWSEFVNVIVDDFDQELLALLEDLPAARPIRAIAGPGSPLPSPRLERLQFLPSGAAGDQPIGMHVPINPLAGQHRHSSLGFTGYVLVLSNRPGVPKAEDPTGPVAWLTAAFHRDDVVVVEGGMAAVWQGRALRGIVPVESRTDLWRLLAHALVTIDLLPGPIIGRESIESMRFGTPIIVPEDSTSAAFAGSGGALTYTDEAGLLSSVDLHKSKGTTMAAGQAAKHFADGLFSNPTQFISKLQRSLAKSD